MNQSSTPGDKIVREIYNQIAKMQRMNLEPARLYLGDETNAVLRSSPAQILWRQSESETREHFMGLAVYIVRNDLHHVRVA